VSWRGAQFQALRWHVVHDLRTRKRNEIAGQILRATDKDINELEIVVNGAKTVCEKHVAENLNDYQPTTIQKILILIIEFRMGLDFFFLIKSPFHTFYTNDTPVQQNSKMALFADDTLRDKHRQLSGKQKTSDRPGRTMVRPMENNRQPKQNFSNTIFQQENIQHSENKNIKRANRPVFLRRIPGADPHR